MTIAEGGEDEDDEGDEEDEEVAGSSMELPSTQLSPNAMSAHRSARCLPASSVSARNATAQSCGTRLINCSSVMLIPRERSLVRPDSTSLNRTSALSPSPSSLWSLSVRLRSTIGEEAEVETEERGEPRGEPGGEWAGGVDGAGELPDKVREDAVPRGVKKAEKGDEVIVALPAEPRPGVERREAKTLEAEDGEEVEEDEEDEEDDDEEVEEVLTAFGRSDAGAAIGAGPGSLSLRPLQTNSFAIAASSRRRSSF